MAKGKHQFIAPGLVAIRPWVLKPCLFKTGLWDRFQFPESKVRCIGSEEQPQVPFDYAQGRLSTPLVAKCAPNYAQDDSIFCKDFS
jgi:hypothetical protein